MTDPMFPRRPTHPDFEKMARIIREFDERANDTSIAEILDVDEDSLHYLANQRVLRALQLVEEKDDIPLSLLTLYYDGFVMGREYQKRKDSDED